MVGGLAVLRAPHTSPPLTMRSAAPGACRAHRLKRSAWVMAVTFAVAAAVAGAALGGPAFAGVANTLSCAITRRRRPDAARWSVVGRAAQVAGFDARYVTIHRAVGMHSRQHVDQRFEACSSRSSVGPRPRSTSVLPCRAGRDHLRRDSGDVGQEVIGERRHPPWPAVGHKVSASLGSQSRHC